MRKIVSSIAFVVLYMFEMFMLFALFWMWWLAIDWEICEGRAVLTAVFLVCLPAAGIGSCVLFLYLMEWLDVWFKQPAGLEDCTQEKPGVQAIA